MYIEQLNWHLHYVWKGCRKIKSFNYNKDSWVEMFMYSPLLLLLYFALCAATIKNIGWLVQVSVQSVCHTLLLNVDKGHKKYNTVKDRTDEENTWF